MTSDRGVIRKDKKSWSGSIGDIGVVSRDGRETISEGIARLNKTLINDKRNLRRKSQ